MNDVLKENERLLEQAISVDIVNIVVHANVNYACKIMNECKRCVSIETELQRDFIKKECYDTLFKQYTTLRKHCISLEVDNQIKQEILQRNNSFSQQSAPTFDQLFEINDLKARSQEKDTVIMKLKERIKSLSALKDTLSKIKGKAGVNEAVPLHSINPELLKIDVAPLSPKLHNNRTAHNDYLKHTQEETATVREIVKNERLLNPLNTSLDYACCLNCSMVFGLRMLQAYDRRSLSAHQLCTKIFRPMLVESVHGKKYILVIVDDYSRFAWAKCLRSKDEASDFIIKFLKMIQVRLKVLVCRIRTDNRTEFVNQTLREYYEEVGISHETSVARSPQQNIVIERRNHTLIKAARTIKTPYELLHNKLPDLSFLHVFGAICYPTNDSENLGKFQPKADIGIFIGYASTKKDFRIYNRRTRRIVETIHVDFDELIAMASKQSILGPALNEMTLVIINVEEDIHEIEVAHMGNDPLFGVPIPEVTSAQSSSTVSPHTIVKFDHQNPQHNSKWTKDHPLDNIIGQLSRPVSTRFQLHEQALFCYYNAFLTSVEPKMYKDALT
nr:hypothetical protein [Tanacetum cinerariifolium]